MSPGLLPSRTRPTAETSSFGLTQMPPAAATSQLGQPRFSAPTTERTLEPQQPPAISCSPVALTLHRHKMEFQTALLLRLQVQPSVALRVEHLVAQPPLSVTTRVPETLPCVALALQEPTASASTSPTRCLPTRSASPEQPLLALAFSSLVGHPRLRPQTLLQAATRIRRF